MFIGALGRERVFLARPRGEQIRTPSDLTGLTLLEYAYQNEEINVAPCCAEIRAAIKRLGCRQIRKVADNP